MNWKDESNGCFAVCPGYFLAMLSEGQVYVLNAGDSASLDCMFHADAYNLFDYPVLWRKTQRDEDTQVVCDACIQLFDFISAHKTYNRALQ